MKKLLILSLFLILASCAEKPQKELKTRNCKNVIFMIGDGMGTGHISATRIATVGPDSALTMDTMPYTGFVKTHSANRLITDSAASGTAMSTGYKTDNGVIGLTPNGTRVKNIVKACQEINMATGLVATSSITHATPASMATHVESRNQQNEIARQLIENKVDVLLGGGLGFFLPQSHPLSKRTDDLDILSTAKESGYDIAQTREELLNSQAKKLLGLFGPVSMKTTEPEPSLADMTEKALKILSGRKTGFFLMVEGSQIDWGAHDNDFQEVLRQTRLFDEAIAVALDFAKKDKHTLVIVTSDHETGGLAVNKGDRDGKNLVAGWTSGSHTAEMVPLFAYGPGGQRFVGLFDNTKIPQKFAQLIDLKDFPQE
ncbi:alkaline phosphatase [candidate division KSB1 bacterium]|nr:alkaline phosphatase [candidate division KSB1 bacterium]